MSLRAARKYSATVGPSGGPAGSAIPRSTTLATPMSTNTRHRRGAARDQRQRGQRRQGDRERVHVAVAGDQQPERQREHDDRERGVAEDRRSRRACASASERIAGPPAVVAPRGDRGVPPRRDRGPRRGAFSRPARAYRRRHDIDTELVIETGRSPSATGRRSSPSTPWTSACAAARSTASSAPTAPARRRRCGCCSGSCARRRGRRPCSARRPARRKGSPGSGR